MYLLSLVISLFSIFFALNNSAPATITPEDSKESPRLSRKPSPPQLLAVPKSSSRARTPSPIRHPYFNFSPEIEVEKEAPFILIIEDNLIQASIGTAFAKRENLLAYCVSNSEDAIKFLSMFGKRPNFLGVCTDNDLGSESKKGHEIILWVKENLPLPIVMHSGDEMEDKCAQLNVQFYKKPDWPRALSHLKARKKTD